MLTGEMNIITFKIFLNLADTSIKQFDFDVFLLYATPIITLFGWLFTYLTQRSIMVQNRKNQKKDRDLQNFRDRLSIINGINSSSLAISIGLTKLKILFQSGQFTEVEGTKILSSIGPDTTKLTTLFYDPSFLSLVSFLPETSSEKTFEYIRETYSRLSDFHTKASEIYDGMQNLQKELTVLSNYIDDIVPRLNEFSLFLSREFSKIDIELSK